MQPRYREKAVKTVRTHVLLVTEEVKTDDMIKALRKTSASEFKGETLQVMHESLASGLGFRV